MIINGIKQDKDNSGGESLLKQREKDGPRIRNFIEQHKGEFVSYLIGAVSNPVASDIYDAIKERLGLKHLVPLISADPALLKTATPSPQPVATPSPKGEGSIYEIPNHYKKAGDVWSIYKLLPEITIFGSSKTVMGLLGEEDVYQNKHIIQGPDELTYFYFPIFPKGINLNVPRHHEPKKDKETPLYIALEVVFSSMRVISFNFKVAGFLNHPLRKPYSIRDDAIKIG